MALQMGQFAKVEGVSATVGVGYTFTLAIKNLDQCYLGGPMYERRNPSCSAGIPSAQANMSLFSQCLCYPGTTDAAEIYVNLGSDHWDKIGNVWPADAVAAVQAIVDAIPDGTMGTTITVFRAWVWAGDAMGDVPTLYKAFGSSMVMMEPYTFEWVGDTEWILGGSASIENLETRLGIGDYDGGIKYINPRSPNDRCGIYCLFCVPETNPDGSTNAAPTKSKATLGGLSIEATVTLPTDENGMVQTVNLQSGGGALSFVCGLAVEFAPQEETSYCEVQNISTVQTTAGGEGVALKLTCSFWGQELHTTGGDTPTWVAEVDKPTWGNRPWCWLCTGDGSTIRMVRKPGWVYGGDDGSMYIGLVAGIAGPVRYNIEAGRFGYKNEQFALPSSTDSTADDPPSEGVGPGAFRVNVGLTHCVSRTETRIVWLGEGLSDWYTAASISIAWNGSITDPTGSYGFSDCRPQVDPKWLKGSGEYLNYQPMGESDSGAMMPSASPIDNTRCHIALATLQSSLDTTSPDWPGFVYHHDDVSADIPPGQDDRPSKWFFAGVETAYGNAEKPLNPTFSVIDPTRSLSRALLSRKPMRFDYLCTWNDDGSGPIYNPDWPMINAANYPGNGDTPAMIEAIPVEDVVNYDNSRILQLIFAKCPEGLDPKKLVLRLTHSHFDFMDVKLVPMDSYEGWDRFGSNSDFPEGYSRSQRTDDFKGSGKISDEHAPETGWTITFDLAQLQRNNTTHLQHVDRVEIFNLPVGDYELQDWRLIEDPEDHNPDVEDGLYPHWTPQPGISPWKWLTRGSGFAATYEGVPHLNIPNGTENTPFHEDTVWGIKGCLYREYNLMWLAEQEDFEGPADPSVAYKLQRLADVLGAQEQLQRSRLDPAALAAATTDKYHNSLGWVYMWDLSRATGDDTGGEVAIRVGEVSALGVGAPLVPTTANIRWITHGRGEGMAFQGGVCVRMDGTSDDDASKGTAQIWKQPLDEEGAVVLDDEGEPMPWVLCGSFSPDITGRFISPPLPESGWQYKTNTWGPGRYVSTECQYITALFINGRPILAISTHHVANAELVSDVCMAPDGCPGHTKLQRGNDGLAWSKRFAMDDGEAYQWGNILACTDRTEYVVDDGADTFLRQAKSLDGEYLDPYKVAEGYLRPFVLEVQGRLLLTAVKDGNCYLVTLAKEPPHSMIGDPVLIGPATEKAPTSLAYCVPHGLLFAAVQTAGGEEDAADEAPSVTIYSSTNRGAEWQDTGQTAALAFPYLYGADATLWLVGFDRTKTGGAQGTAKILKFFAAPLLGDPQVSADVGPADKGRAAIIRRPVGGELIVAAGKVTTWTEDSSTPGIVEYRSTDGGQTWHQRQVHALF